MRKLAFEELLSISGGGTSSKSPVTKNPSGAKTPKPATSTPTLTASPSGTATTSRQNLVATATSPSGRALSGTNSSPVTPITPVPVSTGAVSRVQILRQGI